MQRDTLFLVLVVVLVAGCAAGPNEMVDTASSVTGKEPAGFFLGLWHGLICWFTFLVSLFTDEVSIYEVHNVGGWYDFGFVLGAGILGGGSSGGVSYRRGRS